MVTSTISKLKIISNSKPVTRNSQHTSTSNMKNHVNILKTTRRNILKAVESLTNEQLNHIPKGFNNNIIWNLGHLAVTQQLLCYRMGGVKTLVNDELINKYRKGTKPEATIGEEEIQSIKKSLLDIADCLEVDIDKQVFQTYKSYPTSYGVTLNTIEDAIIFNNVHEGLHYGTVLALKKLV